MTKKSETLVNCLYLKNNYILPAPGIIYSTIISDMPTINMFHDIIVEKENDRLIALNMNRPSQPGSKQLGSDRPDSIFFDFWFLADIITFKPTADGRLLCLFNILDVFIPKDGCMKDGNHFILEKIITVNNEIEKKLKKTTKKESGSIAGLFQYALQIALKQGINFYDSASLDKNFCNAETYCAFMNMCIPFLNMDEKTYESYITDTDLKYKLEFITEILTLRGMSRELDAVNNQKADDKIKNYRNTAANWKKEIKKLEKINSELTAGGLDSIENFLMSQADPDDMDEMPEQHTEFGPIRIIRKIMSDGIKEKDDENDGTFYAEYRKKHGYMAAEKRYIDFVNNLDASEEVKNEIAGEIRKIETNSNMMGPDYNTSLDYLETCTQIPFGKMSSDDIDLEKAKEIIEKSHYGMKDVKKRINEFLTLRKVSGNKNGAIICLVGPPGVGKTSIAAAIAEALGKNYYRFSAGGVRDEAEFIGHRRTYVAAQPGKVIQGIIKAKTLNPVFLIDEVDKLSSNVMSRSGGDASSTLLNILDPEQNKNFTDLYLNFPIDLSGILFILTANDISQLPAPLIDRMEIIEVPSYTNDEKINIVRDFLLEKTIKKFKLENIMDFGSITDGEIEKMINLYTREAGVRGVKNELEKLIRAEIEDSYSPDGKYTLDMSEKSLRKYLGPEKYDINDHLRADTPGTSIGLAWTSSGGCTLKIEIIKTEGKGELKITGQLGDVMKESVNIAFTYLQSIVNDSKFFSKNDFHLHIPEGATPKDGPSAGITILCAFYSLYTGETMKQNLAMTGELTLTGTVMPIGGLKEKLYSAKVGGIKHVLIPEKNLKDLDEIDESIKNSLEIIPVKNAFEVLKSAFGYERKTVKKESKCQPIRNRD